MIDVQWCKAVNKTGYWKGLPCANLAVYNKGYCQTHLNALEPAPTDAPEPSSRDKIKGGK